MRFNVLALSALLLFLPSFAGAQALDGSTGDLGDAFTISVTPQYPTPYSQATLSFLSTSLDLANATMTVSVGGKRTYAGSVQPVNVALGRAGSVANVTVTVTSAGAVYSKNVTIQAQDVSLVAEPMSSSHALYQGKPLVPVEGGTRIVTVANIRDAGGKIVSPDSLSYTWTVDGTLIANSSGIGKGTIIVASPLKYRGRTVSVDVKSQDGALVGGAEISLSVTEPTVRVYVNDPLLGIRFDHALTDTYAIRGAEASLYAVPFSMPLVGGAPTVQWFLNGTAAQTGNTLTLRPAGTGEGRASLSLTATTNTAAVASTNLSLSFGAKPSSNFFGL
ncbi:MAG: hypothetical protein WCT45_01125 [Candidatus Paceibacterota bacterium]|jgi:hypothetical protein